MSVLRESVSPDRPMSPKTKGKINDTIFGVQLRSCKKHMSTENLNTEKGKCVKQLENKTNTLNGRSDFMKKSANGFNDSINNQILQKRNSRSEDNLLDVQIMSNKYLVFGGLTQNKKVNSFEFDKNRCIFSKDETDLKQLNNVDKNTSNSSLENNSDCSVSEKSNGLDTNMMPPLQSSPSSGNNVNTDSQGLIVPRKLINPCLESTDRQSLHRELMFNQKIGKNVLNQKSELQKALQKQKERHFISEQQQQQKPDQSLGGELGRVIMQRAQRLEDLQKVNQCSEEVNQLNPEYLKARAKLRATDSK